MKMIETRKPSTAKLFWTLYEEFTEGAWAIDFIFCQNNLFFISNSKVFKSTVRFAIEWNPWIKQWK
jgi:hypothetical protein